MLKTVPLMKGLLFLWILWPLLAGPVDPPRQDKLVCKTVFEVISCYDKPVEDAQIKIMRTRGSTLKGKTDKTGRVTFNYCLLNFWLPGVPELELSTGGTAYVYKIFGDRQILRVADDEMIEEMSSYLQYSYFGNSDLISVGDSIYLYKVDRPQNLLSVKMKYKTNRIGGLGINKVRSKMKLSRQALKGFFSGKCRLEEDGTLVCPINICSS